MIADDGRTLANAADSDSTYSVALSNVTATTYTITTNAGDNGGPGDCTLTEAIAPPWSRLIELLKKYFNSKIPCGVYAYLLVVTRLMVDSCMPMSWATSLSTIGFKCAMPFSKKGLWKRRILSMAR
mgnify:CR=1 FL=1